MRVIAGKASGRRLASLEGQSTRPTLERVKEGMFSAVQFWLPGANVLDLFAGSGQLGIEALSRGAASCVFVDNSAAAKAVIQKNIATAGFEAQSRIVQASAESYIASCNESFELVILDPPYHLQLLPGLLQPLQSVLSPEAIVLCEAGAGVCWPECVGELELQKTYKHGSVQLAKYRRKAI